MTDNKSLYDAIQSNTSVAEKRLRLDISSIKELINDNQVKHVVWSASNEQLADCLTKKGASSLELLHGLDSGILNIPEQ